MTADAVPTLRPVGRADPVVTTRAGGKRWLP